MSGAVDNLEELDNKALRAMCLGYGLPNIPITDTSKKLLIRRLRAAIGGEQKPVEKSKWRRETSHVTKVGKGVTKKPVTQKRNYTKAKTTSQRTRTPDVQNDLPPTRAAVTQSRRPGRTTAISQLESVKTQSCKSTTDIFKSDDGSIQIPVIVERSTAEPSRQSGASLLSKSIVVTTSYVKDTPRDIMEHDGDEEESDTEPASCKYVSTSKNCGTTKPFSPSLERAPYINYARGSPFHPTSRSSLSKGPTSTLSYGLSSTGGYKAATHGNESKTFTHHTSLKRTEDDQLDAPFLSDFARRLSRLKADPINTGISTPLKGESKAHYYVTPVSARPSIAHSFYRN